MAYHILEGFDLYNGIGASQGLAATWANRNSGGSSSLVAGRFGGQALRLQDGTGNIASWRRSWATSGSNFSTGFAFRQNRFDLVANQAVWYLEMAGSVQLSLYLDCGSGTLILYRGAGTTALITSAPGVMTQANWAFVEIFGNLHQTTGTVEMWLNGTLIGSFTGDTAALGNITYDGIQVRAQDGSGGSSTTDFDDMFLADVNTRIGEARVETIRPTADTVEKDWVASTGSNNYAVVDETLVDNTDYVTGSTVGDLDLYELADLSTTPATIYAVKAKVFAAKTDAQTRKIAAVVRSNATDAQSADMTLAPQPAGFNAAALETNPDGAVAWTPAAVNALKVGVKVTA